MKKAESELHIMATIEKITQRGFLTGVIALLADNPELTVTLPNGIEISNEDAQAYAAGRVSALEKKNDGHKLTDRQRENEEVKAQILAFLQAHPEEQYTITSLLKSEELALPGDVSQNRLNALVKQMYNKENPTDPEFPVTRVEVKRVAYFKANPNFGTDV